MEAESRSDHRDYPRNSKYPILKDSISFMAFGTRVLKYWILGPSGYMAVSMSWGPGTEVIGLLQRVLGWYKAGLQLI